MGHLLKVRTWPSDMADMKGDEKAQAVAAHERPVN